MNSVSNGNYDMLIAVIIAHFRYCHRNYRMSRTCPNHTLRFLHNFRFGFGNHCTGKDLNILMMPSHKNTVGSHSPLYTCSAQIPGLSRGLQVSSSIQLRPSLDHPSSIRGYKTWADSVLVGVHVAKCSTGSWLDERAGQENPGLVAAILLRIFRF